MNAAREKPIEAWRGWPSRLKMRAPETTRPASVAPETRIKFEEGISWRCRANFQQGLDVILSMVAIRVDSRPCIDNGKEVSTGELRTRQLPQRTR
jgi:hypothetical protein